MASGVAAHFSFSLILARRNSWPRQYLRAGFFACLFVVLIASLPAPARAWGCEGHQVIALLAEKHLTPHALAMAKKILAEGPIDPSLSRYCKQGGTDPMADASTWADDYRTQHLETGPWHYIDIPLGTKHPAVEKYCDPKEGCATRAITDQLAILRSANADPQKRADALRFVIHFVGDLHQPLHAGTNNDLGGNCVPVAFFEALPVLRNPQTESYAPNLHGIWDTNILERATTGKTVDQVAADLDESFIRKITRWQKDGANVNTWALESYRIAEKEAYGKLPVRIAVETPQPVATCVDDIYVSKRMLKLNERIEEQYQNMASPFIRQQLAQAGARLAMVLNSIWQ